VFEKKKLQKPIPEEKVAQSPDKMINSWKLHIVSCECFTRRNWPVWTGFLHKTILQRVDALPLLPSHDNNKIFSLPGKPELSAERHNLRLMGVALKVGHSFCHDLSQEG